MYFFLRKCLEYLNKQQASMADAPILYPDINKKEKINKIILTK
jgi:hypothetical protein